MKRNDFWKYILGLCSFGFLNGKLSAKETKQKKEPKCWIVCRTCKSTKSTGLINNYQDCFYFQNYEKALLKYKKLKVYDGAIYNNPYNMVSNTTIIPNYNFNPFE